MITRKVLEYDFFLLKDKFIMKNRINEYLIEFFYVNHLFVLDPPIRINRRVEVDELEVIEFLYFSRRGGVRPFFSRIIWLPGSKWCYVMQERVMNTF